MFVDIDQGWHAPPREHPWTASVSNAEWRYCNFRENPELIRSSLEDFKLWEHYSGVPRFYEFLEWMNGTESNFETNDCGLRPPRIDNAPPPVIPFVNPVVIHSRVTVLFRKLIYNTTADAMDWLCKNIVNCLEGCVPNFPAVIRLSLWPHYFLAIDKPGNVIEMRIWAWGDTEILAMENFDGAVQSMTGCLKTISPLFKA